MDDDEKKLWESVAETVKPIKKKQNLYQEPIETPTDVARPSHQKRKKKRPLQQTIQSSHSTPPKNYQAGLDKRTAEKLSKGKMEIEARIDLHGMNQTQAHSALNSFMHSCWLSRKRCVLIITGKGKRSDEKGGVLRQKLPLWLNEPELKNMVLGIRQAQPKDGGDGAFYILLRRQREK